MTSPTLTAVPSVAFNTFKPQSVARATSTLMYAAQQGDVKRVRKIIQQQPFLLREKDRTGKSPLHYCCTSDSKCAAQAADLMVMAAPDLVESRDEEGFTPLHLAVIAGNLPLVNFLLANNADVAAVDQERHSVVHWATVCGEKEVLRTVLAAGAPVSTPDVHRGYPLHYAAQMCGSGGEKDASLGLQVLQTLLAHKNISVSVEDGDGRQPLLWAASAGSAKGVLALVRAGSPIEASDKDGLTALHCAASRGHTDCIDTLITLCGASSDVIDSNGCTALHYAVTLGHADATALLLAHGSDPNRQDRKGRSPAHCGCSKGQFETVKLLGSHGANLWLRNARGDFPLHEAASSGRRDLVKWLLEIRPSQVNARNNDGRCPIHLAALHDNSDMCKILLDAGAQVNPVLRTSKNHFMTPLDCALQRGFRSTAKYLQVHGGVPANRLGNVTVNTAMTLQIRDDITFWGDTSTDSEREIDENGFKQSVKARKKLVYKRKSGSERELSEGKSKQAIKITSSKTGVSKDKNANIDLSGRGKKTPQGKIETKHDISITREIPSIEIEEPSASANETLKRPRSAKYSKLKSSSGGKTSPPKSSTVKLKTTTSKPQEKILLDKETYVSLLTKDQSTSTGDNGETKKREITISQNTHIQKFPDQTSLLSNTSEEVDEPANITVEAAIHEPPKDATQTLEDIKIVVGELVQASKNLEEIITSPTEDTMDSKLVEAKSIAKETVQEENSTKVTSCKTTKTTVSVEENNVDNNKEITVEIEETLVNGNSAHDVTEPESKVSLETNITLEQTEISKNLDKEVETITNTTEVAITHEERPQEQTKQVEIPEVKTSTDADEKPIEDDGNDSTTDSSIHQSFTVLKDDEDTDASIHKTTRAKLRKQRSKSEGPHDTPRTLHRLPKRSKIPTPLKQHVSKSEKHLDQIEGRKTQSNLETRIPSLPNIATEKHDQKTESKMSAPIVLPSLASDNERGSFSDMEDERQKSSMRKKRTKRRSKTLSKDAKSAGSDYESSNLIDSGFEPSPRSTRAPKWKNMSDRGVNMTSVTQSIQSNIRRYHLERKIFQHLLDLKRLQIRSGQHNEQILVKRAIDSYHGSCVSTVGVGRYIPEDYSFKSFEKFLYNALRKLQKNHAEYMSGLPEASIHPLLCTKSTHRCDHATHAYTGVPCAAYLPKMDHHSIPKIGFNSTVCRPGTGFLPNIKQAKSKAVTLELSHGNDKQVIALPTDKLDHNKRYYVTFTVNGQENEESETKINKP